MNRDQILKSSTGSKVLTPVPWMFWNKYQKNWGEHLNQTLRPIIPGVLERWARQWHAQSAHKCKQLTKCLTLGQQVKIKVETRGLEKLRFITSFVKTSFDIPWNICIFPAEGGKALTMLEGGVHRFSGAHTAACLGPVPRNTRRGMGTLETGKPKYLTGKKGDSNLF